MLRGRRQRDRARGGERARHAARWTRVGGVRARRWRAVRRPAPGIASGSPAGARGRGRREREHRRSHPMTRILVVEDNPDLAFGLRNNLEIEGYEVLVAEDGPTGLEHARKALPDLIMLDLMLPGLDGYRVLRTLRDEGVLTPVLILTARGEEADKVRGFRLGADDYVTKPFGVLELLARVEALLRRSVLTGQRSAADGCARVGDIEVDRDTRLVMRRGEAV